MAITRNLYNSAKPTGRPGCPTCGGAGYFVYDVAPNHPEFGKAQVCACWQNPAISGNGSKQEMRR